MVKSLLTTFAAAALISSSSTAQTTVTYNIQIDSLIGLELTSGDICTAPFTTEEAKQIQPGNSWGGMWTSTNPGTPTLIEVNVMFSVSEASMMRPTTLNGTSNNSVDPGAAYNCEPGTLMTWSIDPTGYVPMGLNTFLVDYTGSTTVHQVDNLPFPADTYLEVRVTYDEPGGAGIGELSQEDAELIKITDLMGREVVPSPNVPLLYVYSNGFVQKVMMNE